MRLQARWRHLEDGALESLALELGADAVQAEGTVLAPAGAELLRYRIECDAAWGVRSVWASGTQGNISLKADGQGHWLGADGEPVAALAGCTDVDIQRTPFTNTLAIRRLGLPEGASRSIRVLCLPVPSLRPEAVAQTYTCLRRGREYRYEGYPPGFSADLAVDPDGLVVAYPGLFERL